MPRKPRRPLLTAAAAVKSPPSPRDTTRIPPAPPPAAAAAAATPLRRSARTRKKRRPTQDTVNQTTATAEGRTRAAKRQKRDDKDHNLSYNQPPPTPPTAATATTLVTTAAAAAAGQTNTSSSKLTKTSGRTKATQHITQHTAAAAPLIPQQQQQEKKQQATSPADTDTITAAFPKVASSATAKALTTTHKPARRTHTNNSNNNKTFTTKTRNTRQPTTVLSLTAAAATAPTHISTTTATTTKVKAAAPSPRHASAAAAAASRLLRQRSSSSPVAPGAGEQHSQRWHKPTTVTSPRHSDTASASTAARTMGRKKIKIERIEGDKPRAVTFNKRRVGLLKKAMELAILSGCEIQLTIRNEDEWYVYHSEPDPAAAEPDEEHHAQAAKHTQRDLAERFKEHKGKYIQLTNDHLDYLLPGKASSFRIGVEKYKESNTGILDQQGAGCATPMAHTRKRAEGTLLARSDDHMSAAKRRSSTPTHNISQQQQQQQQNPAALAAATVDANNTFASPHRTPVQLQPHAVAVKDRLSARREFDQLSVDIPQTNSADITPRQSHGLSGSGGGKSSGGAGGMGRFALPNSGQRGSAPGSGGPRSEAEARALSQMMQYSAQSNGGAVRTGSARWSLHAAAAAVVAQARGNYIQRSNSPSGVSPPHSGGQIVGHQQQNHSGTGASGGNMQLQQRSPLTHAYASPAKVVSANNFLQTPSTEATPAQGMSAPRLAQHNSGSSGNGNAGGNGSGNGGVANEWARRLSPPASGGSGRGGMNRFPYSTALGFAAPQMSPVPRLSPTATMFAANLGASGVFRPQSLQPVPRQTDFAQQATAQDSQGLPSPASEGPFSRT